MPKTITKKFIIIFSCVLLVLLALLTGVQYRPFLGAEEIDTASQNAKIYSGSSDKGVVLLTDNSYNASYLLRSLKLSDSTVIYAQIKETNPSELSKKIDELTNMLAQKGIKEENITVVADGQYCAGALNNGLSCAKPISYVFLNPNYNYDELFDMGVYSCSVISHPKLVAGHAGIKNEAESYVTLYNLLSGDTILSNGRPAHAKRNSTEILLTNMPLVAKGMMSSDLVNGVTKWITGRTAGSAAIAFLLESIPFVWVICLLLILALMAMAAATNRNAYPFATGMIDAKVEKPYLFYTGRFFLWFLAVLFGTLFAILGWVLKAPLELSGLLFISYVLGCMGGTSWFYKKGMPGVKGVPQDIKGTPTLIGKCKAVAFFLMFLLSGAALSSSGMWTLEFNIRKAVLFAVVFMASIYGFIWVNKDLLALEETIENDYMVTFMLVLPYVPLLALAFVFILVGSFETTLAIVKEIIWFFALICHLKVARSLTGSVTASSITTAFLFSVFGCFQLYF